MRISRSRKTVNALFRLGAGLVCVGLIVSCGPSSEDKVAAEIACSQYASSQSGYTPANPPGGKSSVGKGAAVGAVGGAAVGAATSKKSKKVVQGAAIGAAAGAGLGALKDHEDDKKAEQSRAAYQAEYQACMSAKGF